MANYLIIGAGKGIGLKTAGLLVSDHSVLTISRSATPELDALGTTFLQADVTQPLPADLPEFPDVLHGIVYCPGTINLKPVTRLTADDFLNDFRQSVIGVVQVVQRFLPQLRKAEGASVVLFSTVAVTTGMPFHASVASAKGAVEGLTRSLAAELASARIRVNAIAPSLTDTPLASPLLSTPEKREAAARRHPMQRIGTPEELAQLAVFLVTPQSSWITGQIIHADGGMGSLRV